MDGDESAEVRSFVSLVSVNVSARLSGSAAVAAMRSSANLSTDVFPCVANVRDVSDDWLAGWLRWSLARGSSEIDATDLIHLDVENEGERFARRSGSSTQLVRPLHLARVLCFRAIQAFAITHKQRIPFVSWRGEPTERASSRLVASDSTDLTSD